MRLGLEDNTYLHKVLSEYLDNKWKPWAEKESINRKVQDIC